MNAGSSNTGDLVDSPDRASNGQNKREEQNAQKPFGIKHHSVLTVGGCGSNNYHDRRNDSVYYRAEEDEIFKDFAKIHVIKHFL